MSTPLLEVSDLNLRFATDEGLVTAVESASFELMPGEILGLVGESGSGKSVTAKSLMHLNTGNARYGDSSRITLNLDSGPVDVLSLQREQANLDGRLGELRASEAQAEGRITEIDIEIIKLDTRLREEAITRLRDIQYREVELAEQRRSITERMKRLDIRAPVSGVIYGLQVHTPRSVIRPAEPVLYIVPQDRPLVIAARVDPINVDQVWEGQEVSLRFSALDQRTTPELFGTVVQVSPDAFTDDATQMSYYRTEIELSEGERERLPENTELVPGMPVEAFIRTSDRSPLAYLVKPLADYFTKAFRET